MFKDVGSIQPSQQDKTGLVYFFFLMAVSNQANKTKLDWYVFFFLIFLSFH